MKHFLIKNRKDDTLFWNEDSGWTNLSHADWFSPSEVGEYVPPVDGQWQAANIVAEGDSIKIDFL